MDMSPACTAPLQPECAKYSQHPRYADYLTYRNAMIRQMVTASTFDLWLTETERAEKGFTTVYEVTSTAAALAPGWYKNIFGKNNRLRARHGPFVTQGEAEAA